MARQTAKAHVLVVEDEHDVAALVQHALERTGDFTVQMAASGAAAFRVASETLPDLIILDLSLPELDGTEVFRMLRSRSTTGGIPIIILTARAGESDRVAGLEAGADDYVTKPFSLRELVARVRVVLNRVRPTAGTERASRDFYQGERVVVDFDALSIRVDGEPVRLTRREVQLLHCLVANRNRILSRERLLDRVWGPGTRVDVRSVDVHIARLRRKLGAAGQQIETFIGLGYRFTE